MKRLCSRVNLIPVIAKADTLSPADLAKFKQRVRFGPGRILPTVYFVLTQSPDHLCH
jgi:hypothetical protein